MKIRGYLALKKKKTKLIRFEKEVEEEQYEAKEKV